VGEAADQVVDVFPLRLIRRVIPFILVALVVYVGFFFAVDSRAIGEGLAHVSRGRMSAVFLLALASFLLRALRWQYYLRIAKIEVPLWDGLLIFFIGFLLSLTPGKVGEAMKSLLLKEGWQAPVARTAPLVLAERVTDLASVLLLGGAGLLAMPPTRAAGAMSVALAVAMLSLFAVRRLGVAAIDAASRLAFVRRRREKLLAAHSVLAEVASPRPLAVTLSLAVGAWGLQSFCAWLVAGAFPNAHLSLGQAVVACCGPLLAGALVLVPGGLGATEASMAGLLLAFAAPRISAGEAAAITVLFRVATLWFAVLLGLLAAFAWRARRARRVEGAGIPSGAG
jgi:uncharacterized protein (TIRG00374 family)